MQKRPMVTLDGNEAAAYVAHRTNEVIAIYPITPSSPMGEFADDWAAAGQKNIWGTVPVVNELQSEGGASGAVHGALQAGALATTFTASQGLLLMIPNMFKIAGELTPTVFHVSARTVAAHALSIFGDHSDVMATRATGFAMIASNSVQEVMDFALIAQAATLKARVPFVHFFDGFRTSHEVTKVELLSDDDMRAMIDEELVRAHRQRALSPDRPVLRGSAQNPDVFFQCREAVNPFYLECADVVQGAMDRFADLVGRQYHLFDYLGAPDAERVVVIMGSGAEAVHEAVEHLVGRGEKVGLIKLRLFRPFAVDQFAKVLPSTAKVIATLDRTKEPGALGEPLYQDIVTALAEAGDRGLLDRSRLPRVIGGRYGLSSKEFTPAMVLGIFREMGQETPRNHFTVGIRDDVTNSHIDYDGSFALPGEGTFQAVFYGLGADGTVGANKNSIKIIGEGTEYYAQGYFVYDSKKAGSVTVSHLRFGKNFIRSTYLIERADFVACHQFLFLEKQDVLAKAVKGGTFLLNSAYGPEEVWDNLPRVVQEQIIEKELRFYVIDAYNVAKASGLGGRINTVMQTAFFAISGVLSKDEAIAAIKKAIEKTYGKRGGEVVSRNFAAVDQTVANLHKVKVPKAVTSSIELSPVVSRVAPEFVQQVLGKIIAGLGDELPVSVMPADGTFPTDTARWEKRNIALEIPVWDQSVCIQCNKCVLVCPHASIRAKVYEEKDLTEAPPTFKWTKFKGKEYPGLVYTLQVAAEDCTGCALCVEYCPVKNKRQTGLKAINMAPQPPLRQSEGKCYEFFLRIPDLDRRQVKVDTVKGSQFLRPLFEYSGACAACGETPYVKLLTQLFGDRALIANATGCSSIYGGNLPTTPYARDREGRGPTWSNSLFEDNAEFGFGFRLALDKHSEFARELLESLAQPLGEELVSAILQAEQSNEAGIYEQRERVRLLKEKLRQLASPQASRLLSLADYLVRKSVWILGGDGWAYDIGYGGLDHVLASGKDVNVLVLDTEVYSNTGGQMSKSTPRGAVAKFAAAGKAMPKKDLGMIAMTYGNIYVARIAMGASDTQTVRAFIEAEKYSGPSLIIAYSHCIAHGINMRNGMERQKEAVASGYWPLFRYNPELAREGRNPLKLDSGPPKLPLEKFLYGEGRYRMLAQSKPERAKALLALAQEDTNARWQLYKELAAVSYGSEAKEPAGAETGPK